MVMDSVDDIQQFSDLLVFETTKKTIGLSLKMYFKQMVDIQGFLN